MGVIPLYHKGGSEEWFNAAILKGIRTMERFLSEVKRARLQVFKHHERRVAPTPVKLTVSAEPEVGGIGSLISH